MNNYTKFDWLEKTIRKMNHLIAKHNFLWISRDRIAFLVYRTLQIS